MTIRKATTEDIPAIVQLLKASLGDVSSEKSVAYWNWKHVQNPFGPSPVLLAEADGQLVGVRAMMRWDWWDGNRLYRSLRAVDTATHPAYQGKGIFKKLTMALVQQAGEEGIDFIFNTPNMQSRPGYLKMGWQEWGRMPLWIRPVWPRRRHAATKWQELTEGLQSLDFSKAIAYNQTAGIGLHTLPTPAWLQWRYQLCPVKEYGLFRVYEKGTTVSLFVSRKQQRYGQELRIGTVLFEGAVDADLFSSAAATIASESGCSFVTCSGLQLIPAASRLLLGWIPLHRLSVAVTVRSLSQEGGFPAVLSEKKWLPQTGDLELF